MHPAFLTLNSPALDAPRPIADAEAEAAEPWPMPQAMAMAADGATADPIQRPSVG